MPSLADCYDEPWQEDSVEAAYAAIQENPSVAYYGVEAESEDDDMYVGILDEVLEKVESTDDVDAIAAICQAELNSKIAYGALRGRFNRRASKGKSKGKFSTSKSYKGPTGVKGKFGKTKNRPTVSLAKRK